jgi:hypothetical protein
MLRARRFGSIISAASLLAAIAACGTADDSATGGTGSGEGGSGGVGPQLTVTFALTGAISLSGHQNAAVPTDNGTFAASCADYAKGSKDKNGRIFYMAAGLLDGPVAGKKVTLEMWIKDYTGPGSYSKDRLAAPGSEPSIAVDDKIYGTWPDSTSSKAVTDAKGGGVWTFRKLAVTGPGGKPGAAVSGSVKWSCRE